MKQIDYDNCFSDDVYNLKNKFNFVKLLISNIVTLGVCGTTIYILLINNLITDLNLMYDMFLYGGLVMVPIDIYNIKKIKKQIKENKDNAKLNLNNLVYKLQKENFYINIRSLENSTQKQEIDYDNKKIYTRFYMLDRQNQIKILEEVRKLALYQTKENSLYLLDNIDITNEDQKYIKKLKK